MEKREREREKICLSHESNSRPAEYNPIALITELSRLAAATVKWRFYELTLIGKGSMSQKVCKNLHSVRMKLYVKLEDGACGNVSMMPGHADRLCYTTMAQIQSNHTAEVGFLSGL